MPQRPQRTTWSTFVLVVTSGTLAAAAQQRQTHQVDPWRAAQNTTPFPPHCTDNLILCWQVRLRCGSQPIHQDAGLAPLLPLLFQSGLQVLDGAHLTAQPCQSLLHVGLRARRNALCRLQARAGVGRGCWGAPRCLRLAPPPLSAPSVVSLRKVVTCIEGPSVRACVPVRWTMSKRGPCAAQV